MSVAIGHPDNPVSRTGRLFPNMYFLSFKGGLAANKRRIARLSAVELQFQTFAEIPRTAAPLRRWIAQAHRLNLAIVAHAPFIIDKNRKGKKYIPLNIDFVWPIVPSQYTRARVQTIGDVNVYARKAKLSDFKRLVHILGDVGIPLLTLHVSKSGAVLDKKRWRQFMTFIASLKKTAQACDVTLAVETGGITAAQMAEVVRHGCSLNFDTAHYYLDMRAQGVSRVDANRRTLATYKRFAQHVPIIHLCQPTDGMDAHLPLFDKRGAVTINDAVLRSAPPQLRYVILETMPDAKAIAHVHKLLNR